MSAPELTIPVRNERCVLVKRVVCLDHGTVGFYAGHQHRIILLTNRISVTAVPELPRSECSIPASRERSQRTEAVCETKTPAGVSRPEWGVTSDCRPEGSHRRGAHSTGAGLDTIGCQHVRKNHSRLLSRTPQPSLWVVLLCRSLRQREASCHMGYRLSTPQFLEIEDSQELLHRPQPDFAVLVEAQELTVSGGGKASH